MRRPTEMPVGSCSCGAVFACDITGHNLGTAMIEALMFACNMDWDLAWSLLPGDDYIEERVEKYDLENHLIVPGGFLESRAIRGVLFFIRMHEDIREVTQEGVQRAVSAGKSEPPRKASGRPKTKAFTKQEIEGLVERYETETLLTAAREDKRIIRDLQRLLYTGDELLRMRAADMLGRAAAAIAEDDPNAVSNLLQRLFSALTDTAASSWGALDAIGEIIRNRPAVFSGYVPHLFNFVTDAQLRPRVLWSLGRIAEAKPDILKSKARRFFPMLRDPDPMTRAYAAWILGLLGYADAREELERLRNETTVVRRYDDGRFSNFTVGQMASQALEGL
ncbi:MAG: PBS lyase [Deltaproteobacteria bacterium]|nr:PBS lyase [Deltaproteobacteria bacterium]